jgi:hypothetical protein
MCWAISYAATGVSKSFRLAVGEIGESVNISCGIAYYPES